ncbi:MAG: transglutaminase family protein [Pseudorhodobacter sp.]|nr:transglutaminase family protein [Pseudorhodobacter sp.]
MELQIAVTMAYHLDPADVPLLTLEVARMPGQRLLRGALKVPKAKLKRMAGEGGLGKRVWAMFDGDRLDLRYDAEVQISRPDVVLGPMAAMPIHSLPPEALSALRPSRFCPSDLFTDFAGQQFGHLAGGEKVAAITDWVRAEIRYAAGSSDGGTTAIDTFLSRQGVCRDFTHLLCSLLRAANIPARYVSAYGPDVQPGDFHAAAQVWLDGGWQLLDATGMGSASGLAVIAAGRDAADVAFLETSHPVHLIAQSVSVARI